MRCSAYVAATNKNLTRLACQHFASYVPSPLLVVRMLKYSIHAQPWRCLADYRIHLWREGRNEPSNKRKSGCWTDLLKICLLHSVMH